MTRETAVQQRARFEQGWPVVEATLKRWQNLNESPRDFRSVAPAYDFKSYVFTKEDRKTLDTRREEAQRQFDGGDWPGAILLYGTLIGQANGVVARLGEAGGYWLWYVNHDRRMERWRKTVRSNDLPNPKGAEMESIEGRLKEQIRANEFGAPSKALMTTLDQLFKQSVADARAAASGGVLRYDPLRRMPEEPCADGQPDMTGAPGAVPKTAPRLDARRSKPTNNYYPAVARYSGMEGVVMIRALTSPSGCVVYAEIARSSGADLLDDAAMDWTVEAATFSPAIDTEQRPMPAIFQFNVRFKLTD
jgi:TonB family protein